jgi:hypothetical protein
MLRANQLPGVLALCAAACACAADAPQGSGGEPPVQGADASAVEGWQDQLIEQGFPRARVEGGASGELAWRAEPEPEWPNGWRLVGRGRFGESDRPVAWLRFEAPGTAVDELAARALDPLVPIAGKIGMRSVARDNSGRRAVAQLRGELLRAAADASAGEGQSVVSLTIETRPGVLAAQGG